MKLRSSFVPLVVVLACLGPLAAAVPAGATGGKTYKTIVASVAIAAEHEGIEGKISSPKAACLGHRLVRGEIFPGGPPMPLGNVRTDGSGHWSYGIDLHNAPPRFLLEIYVTAKSLGGGALCEAVRLKKLIG